MTKPGLPAARHFVDRVRALYAEGLEGAALWGRIEDAMGDLLADPDLKAWAKEWPMTVESAPVVGNLLFYEDPDYGFVLNATVRKPDIVTNVHDHGDVWTLHGLIEGHETMYRYQRTDDGSAMLKMVGKHELGPGDIDEVPPGKIHQEHAGPTQSIGFIVRARRPGTFTQHQYVPETGEVVPNNGPVQIPRELS